jgi:DNA mismatch repair protein MutL
MKIKILPKELINKIAAGEVVERPASVVKELIENSIDAEAKNISIEIEAGGVSLIKVTDDGSGMSRDDAKLSVLEHATSKISSEADLFNIGTLGFRGEALASISAVSRFNLITRDKESLAGTSVTISDGRFEFSDIGAPAGTSVSVKDLFYNVPARQKYLKTAVTELNHIIDLFLGYCLVFPEISWKLSHNRKIIYQFPAAEPKQRIGDALGDDVANNLLAVDCRLNNIFVQGFIGKPQTARNNRKLQFLAINRRPVNEFIVSKQVKEAFGSLLSKDQYPVYILNLTIERDDVDVNVHPRKLEVRFSEPALVYRTVYQAATALLDENDLSKQAGPAEIKRFVPIKEVFKEQQVKVPITVKPFVATRTVPKTNQIKQAVQFIEKMTAEPLSPLSAPADPGFKILCQLQDSYILVETEKSIKIFDQHASSERIQYEKLKREWQIGRIASQKMLIPRNIELTPSEARLINDNLGLFEKLGFEIADFGSNTFAVNAVPQMLSRVDVRETVLAVLAELTESFVVNEIANEPVDSVLKMFACKSAIKFGDVLSVEGMEALVRDLDKLDNRYTCVHGRPCAVEFNFEELKKMFGRK